LRKIKKCIHINMPIEYSVFLNNFMCIHLENIPKKEKIPKKLKYVSPGTNFLQ
jgi:hypothetical protein